MALSYAQVSDGSRTDPVILRSSVPSPRPLPAWRRGGTMPTPNRCSRMRPPDLPRPMPGHPFPEVASPSAGQDLAPLLMTGMVLVLGLCEAAVGRRGGSAPHLAADRLRHVADSA